MQVPEVTLQDLLISSTAFHLEHGWWRPRRWVQLFADLPVMEQ